ncbi:hypothetical protein L7F22_063701 [Adiantum nelumboides]|nr:hypothetical protein [Adiantum nelumboides]
MAINTATVLVITLTLSIYILHAVCIVVPVRAPSAHDAADAPDLLHTATSVLLHVGEAQALLDFKKGIIDDPLGRLASWSIHVNNQSSSAQYNPCSAAWRGIVCDAQKEHVISLNLGSSNLSGTISLSLAILPALSSLNLSYNFLHGSLPSGLFNLPHSALRHLDLSYNSLGGSLPDSFANLSALLTLDLSSNNFVGEIPPSLGQCKAMQKLYLTGVSGRIPSQIWQLPALIELEIVGADSVLLEASMPQKFASCPTIQALVLSYVKATAGSPFPAFLSECKQLWALILDVIGLEGFIPAEFWQLPLLTFLVVQDSEVSVSIDNSYAGADDRPFKLHGSLPSSFRCCRTITELVVDGVNLTGEIPPSLGQCTALQIIDLSHGSLKGEIPKTLGNLSNLELLNLQSHMLRGTIPKELFQASGLIKLRLGDNLGLEGVIPREVGELKQLQHLSLYTTSLSGPLPEDFCNCTQLVWLDFGWSRSNYGVGKILNCMAKLTKLQTLAWQFNAIHDEVPMKVLRNLTQLEYLDLSWSSVIGQFPAELGNLSNLQHLGFRQNNLSGPIPSELGHLPRLEVLDLFGNQLSGSLPEEFFLGLANGSTITRLFLTGNELQGVIPSSIGRLKTLQLLYVDNNRLHGFIPPSLGNCSALQDLILANNMLQGRIPASLGQLTTLSQNLILSNNKLSGEIPPELAALAQLKVLDLSKNQLVGHVPIRALENCTSLQALRLSNNNLTGRIEFLDLSKMQQLTTFVVRQNNLMGGLPSNVTSSKELVLFDVQRNKLSGALPSANLQAEGDVAVMGLMHLRVLSTGFNQLSGEIPGWVWKLPKLQVLDLSNNHFHGSMPTTVTHLDYFKQDQSKDLNQASTLYEEVPEVIKGSFQVLSYILNTRIVLDISNNYLEGAIAESFGELLGLRVLVLSHNGIQGRIPESLGKLVNLDDLNLSHNKLTGNIPEGLGHLGRAIVDLSFNLLEGPIPTANNFNTRYNSSSFEGNAGLCGAPLPENCSDGKVRMTDDGVKKAEDECRRVCAVLQWTGSFASPWALLVSYPIGLLGGFYISYLIGIIP